MLCIKYFGYGITMHYYIGGDLYTVYDRTSHRQRFFRYIRPSLFSMARYKMSQLRAAMRGLRSTCRGEGGGGRVEVLSLATILRWDGLTGVASRHILTAADNYFSSHLGCYPWIHTPRRPPYKAVHMIHAQIVCCTRDSIKYTPWRKVGQLPGEHETFG